MRSSSWTWLAARTVAAMVGAVEGQGGMIGVLAGPDGVFMVDTQFAPLSEKIVGVTRGNPAGAK